MRAEQAYRYEELASFITGLVEAGTLAPGARAPSLREISKQKGLSVTTALQAYRLLEDRGVLEARPQSGFYVARGAAPALEPPSISAPPGVAAPVAVSVIVQQLLEHAADPSLVPLGCAIPSAGLVMLVIVLESIGVPQAGLALIFAVDRILDMCRTSVNVTGDATVSMLVAKSVGRVHAPIDP